MKITFASLGIAFVIAVIGWASIIFLDPGMNLDKACGIIVGSFISSAILTALVLAIWGRRD
jgi:ABC-type Fe3+-siderophore transport system permease subunit